MGSEARTWVESGNTCSIREVEDHWSMLCFHFPQCLGSVRQLNHFLPKLILLMVFITAVENKLG